MLATRKRPVAGLPRIPRSVVGSGGAEPAGPTPLHMPYGLFVAHGGADLLSPRLVTRLMLRIVSA